MTKREGGALKSAGFGMEKLGWGAFDLFMILAEMGGEKTFQPTFPSRPSPVPPDTLRCN